MFTFLVASFKKHGGFLLVLSVLLLYFAFTSNAEQTTRDYNESFKLETLRL